MSSEILSVPEEQLREVIEIIRAGLNSLGDRVSEDTRNHLEFWCNGEEDYLNALEEE